MRISEYWNEPCSMALFKMKLSYLRRLPYRVCYLMYIRLAVNTIAFSCIFGNEQCRKNGRLSNNKTCAGTTRKKWRTTCTFFFGRSCFGSKFFFVGRLLLAKIIGTARPCGEEHYEQWQYKANYLHAVKIENSLMLAAVLFVFWINSLVIAKLLYNDEVNLKG